MTRARKDLPLGERLLLSPTETADYTRLSEAEIRSRIAAGRFVTTLDGKRLKVFRESIDQDMRADMEACREAQRKRKVA